MTRLRCGRNLVFALNRLMENQPRREPSLGELEIRLLAWAFPGQSNTPASRRAGARIAWAGDRIAWAGDQIARAGDRIAWAGDWIAWAGDQGGCHRRLSGKGRVKTPLPVQNMKSRPSSRKTIRSGPLGTLSPSSRTSQDAPPLYET